MLIVIDFLIFVIMVFYVVVEARMVKSKIRFDLVFKSEVKRFPSWSKTGNKGDIEKS